MKKRSSMKQADKKLRARPVKPTRTDAGTRHSDQALVSSSAHAHHENGHVRALKDEKARLENELEKLQVGSQDHPTTGNHMADDATDVAEQAKTLALRTHLEGMLKEVDRALARIDNKKYGLCEECGRPIGEERLQAMPWVTLCIEHAKISQTPRLKARTVA